MWINPDVLKEWTKSGERRGRVRFSQDEEKRPYLSRVEVKVRKIIYVCKFYSIFSVTCECWYQTYLVHAKLRLKFYGMALAVVALSRNLAPID